MFTPGEKVGSCTVLARLASGGRGIAYLARRDDGAHVALFVLHRAFTADPAFASALAADLTVARGVQHPNVATVFEIAEHQGDAYVVGEFVHGLTVRQLLEGLAARHRRLRPEVASYLLLRVAEALAVVHSALGADGRPAGLVHGDVGVDSVVVAFDGTVKLLGLGLARLATRHVAGTSEGPKDAYRSVSPEQARGEAVDARADVFGLGVLLHELLVMRRALPGATATETLAAARSPSFAPPSQLVVGTPPELDLMAARTLALAPAQRFPTVVDFGRALLAAQPGAANGTPDHLARLVSAVLSPAIERERYVLPPDLAPLFDVARRPPESMAIDQLTEALPAGAPVEFGTDPVAPTAAMPVVTASDVAAAATPPAAPPAPEPASPTPAVAPSTATTPKRVPPPVAARPAMRVGAKAEPGVPATAATPAAAAQAPSAAHVMLPSTTPTQRPAAPEPAPVVAPPPPAAAAPPAPLPVAPVAAPVQPAPAPFGGAPAQPAPFGGAPAQPAPFGGAPAASSAESVPPLPTRGGGAAKAIGCLFLLLALGGGGFYGFRTYQARRAATLAAEAAAAAASAAHPTAPAASGGATPAPTAPTATTATAPADAGVADTAAPSADAAATDAAIADAAVDAAVDAATPAAAPRDAATPAAEARPTPRPTSSPSSPTPRPTRPATTMRRGGIMDRPAF